MEMAIPRCLLLENSETSTVMQAKMPPMPRPVTTRHRAKTMAEPAVAESARPAMLRTRDRSRTLRRPILSATGPKMSAPSAMPTRPELSSIPSWLPLSPNSFWTGLAVKAIARISYAACGLIKEARITMDHWVPPMGELSIALRRFMMPLSGNFDGESGGGMGVVRLECCHAGDTAAHLVVV